jgi:hypothetical protein
MREEMSGLADWRKTSKAVILTTYGRRLLFVMSESKCRKVGPRARFLHALQGHKTVAGGNAPGMRDVRSSTLKGSYYLEVGDMRPA